MEKALHDYFYISQNGKITLYSEKDAPFLFEAANNHIARQNTKSKSNETQPVVVALEAFICSCMEEYLRSGVSELLLEKLNKNLRHIRNQCLVEKSQKKLIAVHVAHLPDNPSPEVFAALMFSNITSLGGLEGLKRCKSPSCKRFFTGRPNVKWCSKTCGSRSRVTKMRKRKQL